MNKNFYIKAKKKKKKIDTIKIAYKTKRNQSNFYKY